MPAVYRWTDEGAPDPDMDFGPTEPLSPRDRRIMQALLLVAIIGSIAAAVGVLWVLMWWVLPAIPWGVAWLIQTAAQATWGAW